MADSNTHVSKEARDAAADLIEWQQRLTAELEQEGKPAWQFFAAGFSDGIRKGIWDDHDVVQAFQRAMDQSALAEREAMVWRPIAELADLYQQPIWIAAPCLVDGDANPLGIAEAYWQDTEGPEIGEWRTTRFDMCNDEWNTISLPKEEVTHFLVPVGPWTDDVLADPEANREALAARDALPDYIDLFRIIRAAGRSDAAKAKAVDALLTAIRERKV